MKQTNDERTRGEEFFHRLLEPGDGDSRTALYNLFRIAIVIVVTAFLLLLLLATATQGKFDVLGQSGDFFGGFVNPLLTFVTFTGILYTVYLQGKDLEETRKENRRQGFEASFFQMLSLHDSIVGSLSITDQEVTTNGRATFKLYYEILNSIYKNKRYPDPKLGRLKDTYASFWRSHRQDLGHYFRYLYNLIRFIHEANIPSRTPDEDPRKVYMKLVRAQLSDYELVLLAYNVLMPEGEKFIPYIKIYDLLDNIPEDLLIEYDHYETLNHLGILRERDVEY